MRSISLRRPAAILAALGMVFALGASPALADKPEKGGKPAHAEKGGKPEKAGKPGHGGEGHGKGDDGGMDASEILAAGATAAVLTRVLGLEPTVYAVGAKPLAPGIRKNLARGKPLPPGIAKQQVPDPVLTRLPRVDGADWIRVGTELILVDASTRVIRQVLNDVFS